MSVSSLRKNTAIALALLTSAGCGLLSTAETISKACNGMTLDQVKKQNSITTTCREAVEQALSGVQSNLSARVIPLSAQKSGAEHVLYAHALDSDGSVIAAADFASGATVTATLNGAEVVVPSSDVTWTIVTNALSSLMTIVIANDYSASMSDLDLASVAEIEADVFNYLPSSVYEGEVLLFSDTVTQRQALTSTQAALLAAIAPDLTFQRGSTALYDGMGTGIQHLTSSTRPIKLLITATDGLENASLTWSKQQIVTGLAAQKINLVMLGTLFSDVDLMKALTVDRGAYVYAPAYKAVKTSVQNYLKSLGQIVQLRVGSAYQNATGFKVKIRGASGSFVP